jgi:hypothetical protein
MKNVNATLASFVVMTAIAVPVFAQQPSPAPVPTEQAPTQDDRQQPKIDMRAVVDDKTTAKGRLVRVDTDLMTIVIKGEDNEEQEFRYTDATKVVGAQEQVSGLSTKAGSKVMVHFIQGAGEARIATKVHFTDDEK